MSKVVLFHHAQGLTAGVQEFADQLRRAGHQVTVPDLYEGATFDSLADGISHAQQVGFGTIIERGQRAAGPAGNDVVYAGFSLGVLPAQLLAQTKPGAHGALLFHACVPVAEFGEKWPDGVPVQIHAMSGDELFTDEGDLDAARELVASS